MDGRRPLGRALAVVLVVVLAALLLGQALGQPVLLSFVDSGSMAPTMEAGDGFVAIPAPLAGDVGTGDVVVFEAETLQGGGLTTHRVVEETERGYITKGDANPFTDQDGGEPPVTDGQIVATALQMNGRVVVIPGLGSLVEGVQGALGTVQRTLAATLGTRALLGTQGLALLIAGAGLLVLVVGLVFDDARRTRSTGRSRRRAGIYDPRRLVVALALFVALVAGGTMLAVSDTHQYGMVSASFESETPTTVPVGESSDLDHVALNGGLLPMHAFYAPSSANVDVAPRATTIDGGGGERNVTVTLQAPPQTGYYPQYVTEHRYFAVLPRPAVASLYGVHPWLPTVATSLAMGAPILLVGLLVVGASPVRTRSRSRSGWL